MDAGTIGRGIRLVGAFFIVWWGLKYVLPLGLPFLVGWALAAIGEPVTRRLSGRMPRPVAAGVSVSLVLLALGTLVWAVGVLCYRELAVLARGLPEYAQALEGRLAGVQSWALELAARAPGSMGRALTGTVRDLFSEGSTLLKGATNGVLSAAGSVAGRLPGGLLTAGTAVISAYLIGAEYPALWEKYRHSGLLRRWGAVISSGSRTASAWLRAQAKLSGLTLGIVCAGFLLLRVEHWLLLGIVTAVVDAVPMLGTGVVLIPMAALALLWGEQVKGIGLIGLYVTAMVTRSALEPKLVGKQLGMTPLATLVALYVGFQIWGVVGMVLSPILAVTAVRIVKREQT